MLVARPRSLGPYHSPLERTTWTWWDGGVIAIMAMAVFALTIDSAPEFDEYYHVLAARSWIETGSFAIADGEYLRGRAFTLLVALSFILFGESFPAARLPSALATFILVMVAFLFVSRRADRTTGHLTAWLLIFSPFMVDMASFARFYALHALLVFLGAVCFFEAREAEQRARVLLALAGVLCFAIAYTLQITTLIALGGVALWLFLDHGLPWLRRASLTLRFCVAGLALSGLVLATYLGPVTSLAEVFWNRLHWAPLWQKDWSDMSLFYYYWLLLYYPILWTSLPFLAVLGWKTNRRLTVLCLCLCAIGLITHSIAAAKSLRYIWYLAPFIIVLFALGLREVLPRIVRYLMRAWAWLFPHSLWARGQHGPAGSTVMMLIVLLVVANPAFARVLLAMTDLRVGPQPPLVQWDAAKHALGPWLDLASVVLATDELPVLYHFGRVDITLSRSRRQELHAVELGRDYRTGRLIISEIQSLEQVKQCFAPGLIIATDRAWRRATQLDDQVADFLDHNLERLPLDPSIALRAYWWQTTASGPTRSRDCVKLPPAAAGSRAPGGARG